jgi:hypothetical protein
VSTSWILQFSGSLRLRSILLVVAAFLPALFTALLVNKFAVNVPVWDDWERVYLIEKFEEGQMTAADLYASHIEHRMVVPRIIMLSMNKWTGGSLRAEMAVIFLTVLATAIAVFLLLRATFPGRPGLLYVATFCANLLLFSPLQWENFLWAVQVAFMLPMCCICWALVVLRVKQHWPVWRKFFICLILALIATHSFSHGMLIWPVVFMMLLLQQQGFAETTKSRASFLGAWLVMAVIVLGCYFSDFQNSSHSAHAYNQLPGEPPPGIANLSATLSNPDKAINFFSQFLGNPLARITRIAAREVAPWIGWGLASCFALGGMVWLLRWKQKEENASSLPWLALGGVAISIAVMVALGRAEIAGVRSALTPRYNSMSLYLLLSVTVLGILRIVHSPSRSTWRQNALALLTGVFVVIQLQIWCYGTVRMREWQSSRLHALTSLLYINHFLPPEDTRLDGVTALVREQAQILDRYGYLEHPLLKRPTTAPFKTSKRPLSKSRWGFDRVAISLADRDVLEIEGWTTLPTSSGGGPAHGILVTRPGTDSPEVLEIASIHALPPMSSEISDNAFNFNRELDRPDFCKWSTRLPLVDSELPMTLTLFAVDAKKMRILPLGKKITIQSDRTVSEEDFQ